ncbi:sulfite exporter TauE/SafE family protein [Arcticibacter sp.]|uniref:sulfite exporter TauE/SafE family protein n=1 Tax=Arcticibacter sp. TaxID=1872630 RepID=UPI0038908576
MEILGYIASAFIGISLGLIGGGGSILTVPVLVYLFGVDPLLATSYSLFVVGSTSLVGAYQNWMNRSVNVKTVLSFGLSSVATVFLIRKYLIPVIPEHLFRISGFDITLNKATMVLFALLMIAAAFSMVKEEQSGEPARSAHSENGLRLLLLGIGIGGATGLLGAGGGFLLVPVLVIVLGLPMKEAVGTSLMIIALNSLVGFAGDLKHFQVDWPFLLKMAAIAIAGLFIGAFLNTQIDGGNLKKGFGWFVLSIGAFILFKEMFMNN